MWSLKYRSIKSPNEIKCYCFEHDKENTLTWLLLSIPVLLYRFWGVWRCLSQLCIDKVKAGMAGQGCFKSPVPRGRFLAEIQIRCSIFPSSAEKDSLFVPFSGHLGKIFLLSAPIRTIFASLVKLSTFCRTLWPSFDYGTVWLFEINISESYITMTRQNVPPSKERTVHFERKLQRTILCR